MPAHDRQRLRERARTDPIFAVQVAGLRQLKVQIRAAGTGQRRHGAVTMAAAAILMIAAIGGAIWATRPAAHVASASPAQILTGLGSALDGTGREAATSSAALAVPVLDLGGAGFRLASVSAPVLGASLLIYQGLHGCRIGLTVSAEATLPAGATKDGELSARTWLADGRRFTLVTRGMDPELFRDLASAMELMTRGGDDERVSIAMRRSSQGRACVG